MTKRKEGAVKGRPSLFSEHIAEYIIEQLSLGRTFTSICAEPDMPTVRSIQYWAAQRPDFFANLARAREAGAEYLIGDLHDKMVKLVADSESGDETKEPPKSRVDSLRLYATHVQWMTARLNPRRYSERVLAEVAKLPPPKEDAAPAIAWDHLSFDERETMLELAKAAKRRQDGEFIEYREVEDNDGSSKGS
jgi:hypothetical protein